MKDTLESAPRLRHATRSRIVLGLDPGTRIVGYGAVVAHARGPKLFAAGVVQPGARLEVPQRLACIQQEIELLVEQAFAARNMQSALRIGEGRGVLLACAARFGAEIVQYPPAVAKKAAVGHGAADKTQVAAMIARSLGLQQAPEPLDASDALALALAWIVRQKNPLLARSARPRK
jgi:crossover junction endodeoxyribonuclease RuvC